MKHTAFEAIDWAAWVPQQRATLVFVIRQGEILLIHKKRGLGAGKINGPGGRLDAGETPLQCAVREVQEELRVTPLGLQARGVLCFQFVDGLSLHCEVFTARDSLWMPLLLAGRNFRGHFLFDGERLLAHELMLLNEDYF